MSEQDERIEQVLYNMVDSAIIFYAHCLLHPDDQPARRRAVLRTNTSHILTIVRAEREAREKAERELEAARAVVEAARAIMDIANPLVEGGADQPLAYHYVDEMKGPLAAYDATREGER